MMIGRRQFIALVGGTMTAWPLAARAQQPERMRRVGVLMNLPADDPQAQARNAGPGHLDPGATAAARADRVRAYRRSIGGGFVESLARPGGNATGFTNMEYGVSGKWLELLKEIAPRVMRAAV